ncbi:unnamed protein product [Phytophthora lilii]|uniref:Unnamed protein product n=1 Tax=Phytophthora lilii TaxID=2077276 RepID=A0A9W7CRV0_9STRA|nr:unnamed protein product [Phytophthora lilii]
MDNPSPVARLATVVARLASPSFRMVSYRRQNDVRRTTRPRTLREEATADIVASDDGEDGVVRVGAVAVAVEDTASPTPFGNRVVSTVDTSSTTSLGFQTEAVQQSRSEIEYREALQTVYRCRDSGELPSWTQAGVDEEKDAIISSPERETESTLPSLAPPLGLPSPRPTPLCLICREPLALHRHTPRRDIVDLLQPLLLLLVFMRATPLSSFAFYFGPMDFRIQRRWLAKIPPVDPSHSLNICADTAARTLVADVASTFSLAHFTPGGVLSGVGAVVKDALHEQMVLRSCADLLLDAFWSQRVQQILSMVTTAAAEVPHEGPASANLLCDPCERFSRLVSDLFDELTLLLVARSNNDLHFGDQFHSGHVSIPSLADDVLSLIDAESKYRALRGHASALLLRTDESLETAVQELFWSFVAHLEQVHELPRKLAVDGDEASAKRVLTVDKWTKVNVARAQFGLENSTSERGADFTSWESRLSRCWCRRWFLAPTSVSVVPLSAASGDTTTSIDASNPFSVCGPSLLSVVAFVRMVSGVDVDLEGTRLVIGAAMSDMAPQMSMAPKMVLELDGRTHAFDSLPNGLSPVVGAAVFGGSLGASVYEGRVAGSGESLEVLLFDLPKAFPQSKTTNRLMVGGGTTSAAGTTLMIHRVRVRLAMDEAWSTGESCLSVFVEVSVVPYVSPQRLRQRHEWLAMVAAGRFRDEISVLRWTPVMEVQASFVGLR